MFYFFPPPLKCLSLIELVKFFMIQLIIIQAHSDVFSLTYYEIRQAIRKLDIQNEYKKILYLFRAQERRQEHLGRYY